MGGRPALFKGERKREREGREEKGGGGEEGLEIKEGGGTVIELGGD